MSPVSSPAVTKTVARRLMIVKSSVAVKAPKQQPVSVSKSPAEHRRKTKTVDDHSRFYAWSEGKRWPLDHLSGMKHSFDGSVRLYLVNWPNTWEPASTVYIKPSSSSNSSSNSKITQEFDDDMYRVERILETRSIGDSVQYRVQWMPTWIPAEDISAAAVREYKTLKMSASLADNTWKNQITPSQLELLEKQRISC